MAKQSMTASRPRLNLSTDELVYGLSPDSPQAPASTPPEEPKSETGKTTVSRVVFTNQLQPEVYVALRQYEYWAHTGIHEILHEALLAYLADKP
ncbi:MAG: hypothetical protein EOO61_16105, partial [Hymenobacter sp.]